MLTNAIFLNEWAPLLQALIHSSCCGWNVANNLTRKHVPRFDALPSKTKTTLMAISCERSGSKMDFFAGIFISFEISVSKSWHGGKSTFVYTQLYWCQAVSTHSKYRVLVMFESTPPRDCWPFSTASSLHPSCLHPPRPHPLYINPVLWCLINRSSLTQPELQHTLHP